MTFGEYLWGLLTSALRRSADGDLRKWVDAWGAQLDLAKAAIFKLRRSWLIATAQGQALDVIGQGRKLPRYPGETDDDYRLRLSAAWEIYRRGGTIPGMQEALRLIGYPEADIYELYKDGPVSPFHNGARLYDGEIKHSGGVRWAEFRITAKVDEGRNVTRTDMAVLMDTVYRLKPARSMPTAMVFDFVFEDYVPSHDGIEIDVFFVAHALREEFPWPGEEYNGRYGHDGTIAHDSARDALESALALSLSDAVLLPTESWSSLVSAKLEDIVAPASEGQNGRSVSVALEGRRSVWRYDGSLMRVGGATHGARHYEGTDQFPDGPTLHDGRTRASIRRYSPDTYLEDSSLGGTLRLQDAVPGAPSYGSTNLVHNGGYNAWRHNGRITRGAKRRHDGSIAYSDEASRWRTFHHYGDRLFYHDGLERYSLIVPRDGTWTHGSNTVNDLFGVVVKRHGHSVAA